MNRSIHTDTAAEGGLLLAMEGGNSCSSKDGWDWCLMWPRISASRAMWTSEGHIRCFRILMQKRGNNAKITVRSSANQKRSSPHMWNETLQSPTKKHSVHNQQERKMCKKNLEQHLEVLSLGQTTWVMQCYSHILKSQYQTYSNKHSGTKMSTTIVYTHELL
jgi:hypothetical protein